MKFNSLPSVGQIQGAKLQPHEDPTQARVEVQYTGQNNEWFALDMQLLDALYLANLLEAIISTHNLEHLRRPPGTKH